MQPSKKDGAQSASQKRRQELIEQLTDIRKKQAGGKSARTSKQDQIKRLDEQLRSRIAEQKAAKGKVAFKSAEDLDRYMQRLEDQVNGGMMKLVDEKKALSELTSLKKTRKSFAQFDVQEKQIGELRASIKQIKDSMDDPEAKAMSDRYNAVQAELDGIKAEQDVAYKNLSGLRDERSRLHAEQRDRFDAIRKLKDEYYGQKKAFAAYEREARQKAWERKQAERDRIERDRKKERAQRLLAEASDPAYIDEIRRARSLLHFFDPSSTPAPAPAPVSSSAAGLGAQATRKVDDSGLKGTRLVRKEDRDDTFMPAAKKGAKKPAKKTADVTSNKGYSVPPSVIEDCASMGLDPPASQADVAAVQEKVKAKLAHWEADQEAQTQRVRFFFLSFLFFLFRLLSSLFLLFSSFFSSSPLPTPPLPPHTDQLQNVEKAKKEIDRIEKEEAQETAKANGKPAEEPKAVVEVTADLKNATIEDKDEEKKEESDKEETEA